MVSSNRRDMLRWIGTGFGSLLGLMPILSRSRVSFAQSASPAADAPQFQAVGKIADLEQGFLLVEEGFEPGPALMIRDPENEKALIAVNPTCPHRGCIVDWKPDQSQFICPCHASAFKTDGSIVKGPTQKPLSTYEAKLEGEQILLAEKA